MEHERFMQRCMELAALGEGYASPNPMVGSMVVFNDKIIGEGYHKAYGSPHAEPNAIDSVKDRNLLPEATLYVNLEPCNHWGKTPPCTEKIIGSGIRKVVIGSVDEHSLVKGGGIARLKEAGVEVIPGILEEECRQLNRRFFTYHTQNRPYIVLKWAQTADGFVAQEDFSSKWISNQWSRILVHRWRAQEDAVMVGTNTALYDNPQLNVRGIAGRQPIRVLLDLNDKIPASHYLQDSSQVTICYTKNAERQEQSMTCVKVYEIDLLPQVLNDLHQRKMLSVLVEGGTRLLNTFLEAGTWDEARVFVAAKTFGKGIAAPKIPQGMIESYDIEGDKLYWISRV